MDHGTLLAKYMGYVLATEGTDFVPTNAQDYGFDQCFTEEERAELQRISRALSELIT